MMISDKRYGMEDAVALICESFRFDAETALKKSGLDADKAVDVARRIALDFNTSKERKSALHWIIKGRTRYDVGEFKRAVELSTRYGIDPSSVDSPTDIIDSTKDKVERDHVMTFDEIAKSPLVSDYRDDYDSDDGEYCSFEISDSRDGMDFVRKIVDSQWGKSRNPWCLISRQDDGSMDNAWSYWRKYCGSRKRIGFKDGKIIAFAAVNPFDEGIGYPGDAYVDVAEEASKYNIQFREALDAYDRDESDEPFGDWLYNNNESIFYKCEELLDARGWMSSYDQLGIEGKYEFENMLEWWDMDDERQNFLTDCG